MSELERANPTAPDDQAERFAEIDQLLAAGKSPPNVPEALRPDVDFVSKLREKWSAGRPSRQIEPITRLEWMPGQIVNGYRIIRKLGQGNGEVYESAKNDGKAIALKRVFLDNEFGRHEEKSLQVLKPVTCHPRLVSIFDSWPVPGANELGILMELGDGKTLADLIGKVDQKTLLKYMKETAEGLDYLHSKNLVHQDIKPSNLFLFAGTVKVGDYSGVRSLKDLKTSLGTEPYMNDDHKNGKPSSKSDQHSLVITYLEMRTGKATTSPDLTKLEPSEALVVTKALSKECFASCVDFVCALESCFDQRADPATVLVDQPAPTFAKRSWRSGILVIIAVAVLAAAFIGGTAIRNAFFPGQTEVPDFSGEWEYVCTAKTKDYQHGGVCTMKAERTKDGITFTIFGVRKWKKTGNGDREVCDVDWVSTWGMLSSKDEIRFEYLVQVPYGKGKVENVVGYGRGKVTFEDGKPAIFRGTFNQDSTNDPLFGSMVFTRKK